jgi:SAM-dependent methyltransferase
MTALDVSLKLSNVTPHAGCIIRSTEPLTIQSSPRQWQYAVSVSLPARELDLPLTVSATVSVESGELGCLLVARDMTTLVGGIPLSVRGGRHTIDLLLEQKSDAAHLVFRNTGSTNEPCVFTVESVVIAHNAAERWWDGFADVDDEPRASRDRSDIDDVAVFDRLRQKWSTVPAGLADRRGTDELLALGDDDLKAFWVAAHRQATTGTGFPARGWYQTLYRDVLRDKKVLEIGSGMGIDGIEFARHGAHITFVDIVQDNLRVMKRLCGIFGLREAGFVYLQGFASFDPLPNDYDVIWCQGSQINAPFEFARCECAAILPHLKSGGRWIELAYPRERWVRDGSLPFRLWGNLTDGAGTPWVEWYDLRRLLSRLDAARFEPVLAFNFHHDDFNWFDLLKLG